MLPHLILQPYSIDYNQLFEQFQVNLDKDLFPKESTLPHKSAAKIRIEKNKLKRKKIDFFTLSESFLDSNTMQNEIL